MEQLIAMQWEAFVLLSTFVMYTVLVNRKHRLSNISSVKSVVKNVGTYWNGSNIDDYGKLTDVRSLIVHRDRRIVFNNHTATECFKKWITGDFFMSTHGTDNEAFYAITKFFWGQMGGIVLELGAVDGIISSQSRELEHLLGWHRILIEANPDRTSKMSSTSPEALAFNCAICKRRRTVHFLLSHWGDVSGIVEFMSPAFVKKMHPYLLRINESEWTKQYKNVREVRCVPLQYILAFSNISHINFFILDVEGGEMEVLSSIHFDSVIFDVIVVETECEKKIFRPPGYEHTVVTFLAHQGYVKVMCKGRNTWFRHQNYNVSALHYDG